MANWTFWQRVNYGAVGLFIGILARFFLGWNWLWELVCLLFYGQFICYPTPPANVPAVDVPKYRRIIRMVSLVIVLAGIWRLLT